MGTNELAIRIWAALKSAGVEDATGPANALDEWLRAEGRAVVARALGLPRPEDTLRKAADEIEANYPPDIWIPPSKTDLDDMREAIGRVGHTMDALWAHTVRHWCGVLRRWSVERTGDGDDA